MANTGDIDIAQFERLSVALEDHVDPALADTFSTLKFDPVPDHDPNKTWRWAQGGSGQLVEFLTPAFGQEIVRELPALGVNAQALNYLNYLIADPIYAAAIYRSGILVQVPRPEKFAVHKLIVADRRRGGASQLKASKDREQAAFFCLRLWLKIAQMIYLRLIRPPWKPGPGGANTSRNLLKDSRTSGTF